MNRSIFDFSTRHAALFGSAACLAISSIPASAQTSGVEPATESPEGPQTGITGDIIVTAQKRSERLRDVPMSIVAASGDRLKTLGVTDFESIAKVAPGFTSTKNQYGQSIFFLRGVGFSDLSLGASPAVSTYTDQLPLPYAQMARGLTLDLERVEVLKGPQGTLFGQNATGGAVNFIAAKPTRDLKAGFDLTYGRFNEVNLEAYVSGPITDTLSARLAVRQEYSDDWQKSYVSNDELGEKHFRNARLTLAWEPRDDFRVQLMATGWTDKSDSQQPQLALYAPAGVIGTIPFPVATFPTAPKDSRAGAWDPGQNLRQDNWLYQFGGRVDWDISDAVTLTSLTSYAKFAQHVVTDFDGTSFPIGINAQDGNIRSFSQELRLSGTAGPAVKWMIGANYQDDSVFERLITGPVTLTTSFIPETSFYTDNLQKVENKSVFGSLDVDVSSTLTLQGAARYTKQNRDWRGCLFDNGNGKVATLFNILFGIPINPGTCQSLDANFKSVPFLTQSLEEDNVSWRGGVNWKPARDILVYANVTKGYKSGSFPTIPYTTLSQAAPVKQESVTAYEVGAKLSLLDRMLDLDGALFYYDYTDKQINSFINIPGVGVSRVLASIPKAKIKGAEISATLRPLEGLTFSTNLTYVHSRIDRDPVDRVTGVTIAPSDYNGKPSSYVGLAFDNTPKWQGNFDAQYRFPVSDSAHAYVGANATYHSSTFGLLPSGIASTDALIKIPRYALLDLRVGLETDNGRWRAELWGRNVTNKYYLVGAYRVVDYYLRFPGRPASYGLSVFFRY